MRITVILFSLLLWIGGCGQKGPLYLPQEPAATAPDSGQSETDREPDTDRDAENSNSSPPAEKPTN